jgi:hypothetical protein
MLARYRQYTGSLTRAALLSARNDVSANLAIIAAGLVTVFARSGWPDLVVGLGIALMNADAAKEIYQLVREEHRATLPWDLPINYESRMITADLLSPFSLGSKLPTSGLRPTTSASLRPRLPPSPSGTRRMLLIDPGIGYCRRGT